MARLSLISCDTSHARWSTLRHSVKAPWRQPLLLLFRQASSDLLKRVRQLRQRSSRGFRPWDATRIPEPMNLPQLYLKVGNETGQRASSSILNRLAPPPNLLFSGVVHHYPYLRKGLGSGRANQKTWFLSGLRHINQTVPPQRLL